MKKEINSGKVRIANFNDMINKIKERNRIAEETHKKNNGMCQLCGKEKAEYPNGFNPYHCETCNEKTLKIVNELSKDKGFTSFSI